MGERTTRWIGATLIAAGVAAALLLGSGLAVAEPESDGGGGGTTASDGADKSKPAAAKSDSPASVASADTKPDENEVDQSESGGPAATPNPTAEPTTKPTQPTTPTVEPTAGEPTETVEPTQAASAEPSATTEPRPTATAEPKPSTKREPEPTTEPEPSRPEPTPDLETQPEPTTPSPATAPEGPVVADRVDTPSASADGLLRQARATVIEPAPAATVAAIAAAEAAPPAPAATGPSLINVLGTLAWSLFDFVSKILEGPPAVPAGSSVSVGRSKLEIDCGDGYTADADWYYPTQGTPDKLIYFQHGFPARAGFYNITAAELAERNNAIVVAPSITGNLFACDGCQLGADQMHAAVAKLFLGDPVTGERTALAQSAAAAGYVGELPEDFVIAGHSGGGQLAAGAAGYYAEYASPAERALLKGVLLLDTSASGGAIDRAMPKLDGIPVLHIAAAPATLNSYGNANAALAAARPGEFIGFQLVGGSHSDAFRSSGLGGLTQLIVGLGTGFSTPENVEAVQVLAHGWITDWFAAPGADPVGIYGDPAQPGSTVAIPTTARDAQGYVLPLPPPALSIVDRVILAFYDALGQMTLATCAADPDDMLAEYVGLSARHSTSNRALSLDGQASKGQSVGQHVCSS